MSRRICRYGSWPVTIRKQRHFLILRDAEPCCDAPVSAQPNLTHAARPPARPRRPQHKLDEQKVAVRMDFEVVDAIHKLKRMGLLAQDGSGPDGMLQVCARAGEEPNRRANHPATTGQGFRGLRVSVCCRAFVTAGHPAGRGRGQVARAPLQRAGRDGPGAGARGPLPVCMGLARAGHSQRWQ
jgi:hypothetical protein